MYIFGYLFQKWDFKGSSKKRAHRQKTFFGGGRPPLPSFLKVSMILKFWMFHSNLFHSIQKQPPKL